MDVPGDDTDRTLPGKWAVPEDQSRLIRLFLVALTVFCLVITVLAWWRGAPLLRYLGPLAVTVGGFVVLAALAVAGWRLIDRL